MRNLKIAFFGTSDRSISILDSLKQNFNLVLCLTKSDVTFGRHQEKKETAVKKWAKQNDVNLITTNSLKGIELENIIEQLISANVDYILVADFSFMIPDAILEKFPNKVINIHFSLLPKYRGASPVQFSILNGDEMTGITYHLVVRKMDAGDIIHQIGYKLASNETSGFLYDTLFQVAARALTEVINKFHSGELLPRSQNETEATYTLSPSHTNSTFIFKEDAEIDWKKNAKEIECAIRAYNPWPIAWTTADKLENNKKLFDQKLVFREGFEKNKKVKIYEAMVTDTGLLEIATIQLEGKNKMSWKEFLNGYSK